MFRTAALLALVFLAFPCQALAQVKVLEDEEAETLYKTEKENAQILVQQDKTFHLRVGQQKTSKPEAITVKANERFYITNEEQHIVHNVYDVTDPSWSLRKQKPSKVAAITFHKPGTRQLRCAIHPAMKIDLHVIP